MSFTREVPPARTSRLRRGRRRQVAGILSARELGPHNDPEILSGQAGMTARPDSHESAVAVEALSR
jgi:hypothetical protein